MEQRRLGRTELRVSALGFGAWEIGWTPVAEGEAVGRLLNHALDSGINFVDSSAAYRWSEELIAKHIGHRRHEFLFATKCGSGRVQQPDGEWVQTLDYSAAAIAPQIERSLQRLQTDYIDIMQLHSPSLDDLVNGDGLDGLQRAQEQGKIRFVSLSADDEAAQQAVEMGAFDTLQLSYNILHQEAAQIIAAARAKDMGIIIKEPIATAMYEAARPEGDASKWDLAQQRLAPAAIGDLPRVEASLRWLFNNADVHTAIVGTTNIDHLNENVASAERGMLSAATCAAIAAA
ncbi:MAG TPA: aldo/keto reductase [Candidatus Handelsmanbacteria bacterium]|nr:aldo/keto reductase [Candidatus Handelsmanbacteria bacterium]